MEWNAETVLDALNDFERKPEINPILDEYLQRIAKNGEIVFPWCKLKPLLKKKLEVVLDEFYETCPVETSVPVPNFETFNFDNLKKSILQAVDAFPSAPFTIQRLCELVTNPQKHYNRTDKYMRGIEKNVLVVSTIEPRSGSQGDGNNANNNVIVNGMVNESAREDNDTLNGHENESADGVSSSNLNTPSNHVLLENFANVFPSAACIPSASNICITRDIDSNFIPTSECVESQEEVDFETSSVTAEQPTQSTKEPTDEAMDTSEEGSSTDAVSDTKTSVQEVEKSDKVEAADDEKSETEQPSAENAESDSSDMDSVGVEDKADNKVESAEVPENLPATPEKEVVNSGDSECQQDDTVSQSDDTSIEDAGAKTESVCELEAQVKEELGADTQTDSNEPVSDSPDDVSECQSEPVQSSMELESDKCFTPSPE